MKPDTPTTTFQLPLLPYTHRNQQLFSDHYLDTILPGREEWRALVAEAESVMQQLQAVLANFHPSAKEAQTEEDFVKPVLKALGHLFEVQASLETPGSVKAPDYIFYRDQAALAANKGKKLNESLLQGRALAVGDAKYWDRPLDVPLKHASGDLFDNKNPSYQISFISSTAAWIGAFSPMGGSGGSITKTPLISLIASMRSICWRCSRQEMLVISSTSMPSSAARRLRLARWR